MAVEYAQKKIEGAGSRVKDISADRTEQWQA
jgi:hypothetical protein